ncbi:SDR family NAD(P)-dependent oxidoreductase [Effusibacillus pohliae]|uniref:SDR family NAD(P)-dependent oxidoreductase n=1 Tax=Effusibacillus pohliae TaxID=232270 RepID=UPI00037212FC|nr:SDR family oxidoreductase [Effusibacillus pohliae]
MGKTALITGASSGIGRDLTKLFARDGYDLVLVARSESVLSRLTKELQEQFGISVKVIVKDLALPASPVEIYEELQKESIRVNVLVNNAGFGLYGFFSETDGQAEWEMIQLNIAALTQLTKLFLPAMMERGEGKILNVASMAAFQPGPLMAVYYATKAYVLSFSEALANELQGTGVSVTALCPGPTSTGFEKRAGLEQSKLFKSGTMDSETVANIGYVGLMQNKTVVIPGLKNKLMAFSVRFLPRNTVTRIVRMVQGKLKHEPRTPSQNIKA